MGQCLSQSGRAAPCASGGRAGGTPVAKQDISPKAPLAAHGQPSRQEAVPAPKPEGTCPDLYPFPSSASEAASTQPSAAHVTPTESMVGTETLSQGARAGQADLRQLHRPSQGLMESKQPASSVVGQERPFTSLSVLSTCLSSSPAACRRVESQAIGGVGEEKQEDAVVNADEIVINQGCCCGPIGRKELDSNIDPEFSVFTKDALDNGLAGLPHDVVKYGAPRPANEHARMATIRALRNMGMNECPELDLILKVICRIWQAPSACVTLLDSDHVFICSAEGGFKPAHSPWSNAMCPWMLLSPNPAAMAVGDLAADARFSKSLHVAGGTRSYLTSPLVASNGHRLGAICFTDVKPRRFDAGDCRLMNNCAELAMRALEAHMSVTKRLGLPSPTKGGGRYKPLGRRGSVASASSRASSEAGGGGRAGGLEMDDGTLMEEYANRVRDVAETDEAVVLLLDTRTPGWTILYVSSSWEALTGTDRAETMGATLNEVMAHVSGDPRVVWEGIEREAAAGKAFVTPRVYCKASPGITFYLSFRPASFDDLDDQTVTLGVPASLPQTASASTSTLFFARLHATPDPPANSVAQSVAPSAFVTTGRRLPPSIAINPVQGLTEMFEGLVVGQVLGQGSYGTVYHAKWHGVDVAIKVQDMHLRNAEERARAEFEVSLGQRLHHLNVVNTLAHASALLETNKILGVLDSCNSNAWNAGLQFAPLAFMVATRASGAYGPGGGRDSVCPEDTDGMGMDGAPAFIPFFLGGEASAAGGSVGGGGSSTARLVDGTDVLPAAAGSSHGGGGGGGLVDRPSFQPSFSCANALTMGVVSGALNSAVMTVALPSGAHVPLLRNTQRHGGAGGSSAMLQSLAAIMAARGSSMSGSPRGAVAPASTAAAATPASSQGSDAVATPTAAMTNGGESPFSGSGAAAAATAAARSWLRKPSFTRFADGRIVARNAVAAAADNGSGGGGDGGGEEGALNGADAAAADGGNGMTLVPFLTADSPAPDNARMATMGGGLGGGSAAAVSGADCTSMGRGGFGSALNHSSNTRGFSTINTGPGTSAVQNLALPRIFSSDEEPTLDALQEEDNQQQQPASASPSPSTPRLPAQRQQSLLLQPHQSGAMALSGAYNGMSLLPYMDGGAGFATMGAVSGATGRLTAGGGPCEVLEGGGVLTTAAGIATTVQGAIGADLSGMSYPLDVRLWMVLEFMDKGSLQDAIDRGWLREGRTADHGPDYSAVLATAQEVAAAVSYLHAHDVVHGDLSAVNVLLQSVRQQQGDGTRGPGGEPTDSSGRGFIAKISDFGLSMQLKRPDEAIKTGSYGTITHMAPEVLRDSALSKAGDVYAVGVLLWQMVTGSRPWAGLSHLQVSVEVGTNMRQLVWPTWVHAGVRLLGQRCLSPRPAERPTAAQMQAELAELMRQVPQYG